MVDEKVFVASIGLAGVVLGFTLNRLAEWWRDANGDLGELKIANRSTTYTYDSRGNKLTETDVVGNVIQ